MMRIAALLAALTLAVGLPGLAETHLKVGDRAPNFTLPSTHGEEVELSSFTGKGNVVLAFYPAAFTGGCTREMQAYQFNIDKFTGTATTVFGVSTDNVPSQRKFSEELGVGFAMLSDFRDRKVSEAYGVLLADRGVASRTTFVIDKEGVIQHIEQGSDAIDVSGAAAACSRLAH